MKSIVERLLALPNCEDPDEILNAAMAGAHEIQRLQAAAHLRRKADQRAIEAWHKMRPEAAHMPPNHEDVVMWLMEQHDQFETRMKNDRDDWLAESADELTQALKWRAAINDALTNWLSPIEDHEAPADALQRLIRLEVIAALDPKVSQAAADLVAQARRDALEEAARFFKKAAADTPLGHEDRQRGASTYNWLMYCVSTIRALKGEGDE
jgi:hypothetical protein